MEIEFDVRCASTLLLLLLLVCLLPSAPAVQCAPAGAYNSFCLLFPLSALLSSTRALLF